MSATQPPYQSEQEAFWAGEFGDAYISRTDQARNVAVARRLGIPALHAQTDGRWVADVDAVTGAIPMTPHA